jgi:hypothetical protein
MTHLFRIHLVAVPALLLASACAGDAVSTGVSVQFVLCDRGDDVCISDDVSDPRPDPEVEVGCAVFMIRDVRLESDSFEFDERVWEPIDLFDPATSEINLLDIETGTYDRVRLKLEPLDGFLAGPTDRKVSTFVCGTAGEVYFEYRDDTYDTIELRDDDGIEVISGEVAELAVAFDVAAWFEGLDIASLEPAEDGVVYIDEKSHSDLQNEIRHRKKDAIDLVRNR